MQNPINVEFKYGDVEIGSLKKRLEFLREIPLETSRVEPNIIPSLEAIFLKEGKVEVYPLDQNITYFFKKIGEFDKALLNNSNDNCLVINEKIEGQSHYPVYHFYYKPLKKK